jgi:hypothetical protein
VAFTSGGVVFKRRRKRRAARLRLVAEDTSSTSTLFEVEWEPIVVAERSQPPPPTPIGPTQMGPSPVVTPPAPSNPLVRYEWRSPDGQSLVVEAAWPVAEEGRPGDARVDLRATS